MFVGNLIVITTTRTACDWQQRLCSSIWSETTILGCHGNHGNLSHDLQWLIRATEIRGIVYMYPRTKYFARMFRRETKETDWSFNLPLWPLLSDLLDQDTTSHIFSFLDDCSFEAVTKVSKEFYHCLDSTSKAS